MMKVDIIECWPELFSSDIHYIWFSYIYSFYMNLTCPPQRLLLKRIIAMMAISELWMMASIFFDEWMSSFPLSENLYYAFIQYEIFFLSGKSGISGKIGKIGKSDSSRWPLLNINNWLTFFTFIINHLYVLYLSISYRTIYVITDSENSIYAWVISDKRKIAHHQLFERRWKTLVEMDDNDGIRW